MRNPPRRAARKATFAYPGAVRRRVAWGGVLQLAPGWRVVDVRGTPRIVDPLGWRRLDLPGDGFDSRGAYTVRPAQIRALSPACRDWFKATARNVAASNARIKAATTVRTIAELNPTIAAREARLRKWATGGARKLETPAPYNPSGPTAACPANGWCYFANMQVRIGHWRDVVNGGLATSKVRRIEGDAWWMLRGGYDRLFRVAWAWMDGQHVPVARVQIRRAA